MKISDLIDDSEIIIKDEGKYYKVKFEGLVYEGWDNTDKIIVQKGKRISRKELLE